MIWSEFFKVYRAYRELDMFSEGECRALMQRVRENASATFMIVPAVIGALVYLPLSYAIISGYAMDLWMRYYPLEVLPYTLALSVVLGAVVITVLLMILTREVQYWFAVGRELRRKLCRKCGQTLIGLPLEIMGDTPDPNRVYVRCAECGYRANLLELGLTRRDLIPADEASNQNVGKLLKVSKWGGKHYCLGERTPD
ncbi:MAG: hypothetical protein KF859_02715 [Phycisphaeraceae bacterium]|nr:hypothetical protein [Phycisphaeraceae bacterium]